MGEVNSTFIYNGVPTNGATAKLWRSSGFAAAPAFDDAEPAAAYQVGGNITTGTAYGADGAYRWEDIDDGDYYVSVFHDSRRAWLYYRVSSAIATLEPALTRWVIPGWYGATGVAQLMVAGDIYYIPIFVSKKTTFIRIGAWVSVQAVGSADLRIFEWDDGLPGVLVLSAGTIDTNIANANEIVIAQELVGYFFLAIRCSAAPQLQGLQTAEAIAPPVAGFETSMQVPRLVILKVTSAYADPAPAPTGGEEPEFAVVYLREN